MIQGNSTVKQTICALLLVFSAVLVFPQTKADTFVHIMDVESGPPEERGTIQQNLKTEVRALGYSVTGNVREADYLLNCSVKGAALPLMVLTLLTPREVALVSRDLVFTRPEEAYARFPATLQSMFAGQPLRQRPVNAVIAAPGMVSSGTSAAAQNPVTGLSAAPGTAVPGTSAAAQNLVAGVSAAPGTVASGTATPGTAAEDLRFDESPAPDAWKYKWFFLNARIGVSTRYFFTKGMPAVLMGLEGEFHPLNFFALQFGLNSAMAWDPRTSMPIYDSYIVSIPFMGKFIFNTSTETTLGVYMGGYASFNFLGPTKPPPLGLLAGADLAVKAGPGAVFFDIRYSVDLDDEIDPYDRMLLTLSTGYKFGFGKKAH
ncbi:hypothetical protein AGMMS49942_09090 [Spirochaetia bacterium]|nr:hypothetical protein AGMMS49942_09090 [Spirochaetia bacterium]